MHYVSQPIFNYGLDCYTFYVMKTIDMNVSLINHVLYIEQQCTQTHLTCLLTCRRLLSSKAANERSLFALGLQNQYGKTALHYLGIGTTEPVQLESTPLYLDMGTTEPVRQDSTPL